MHRKERLATQNLGKQAFRSFCPRFRKVTRHARKQEIVLAPLFPGYVFVRFNPERHPWRSINGTLGVKRLVGSDQARPQHMPEAVMEHILSRCGGGDIITRLLDRVVPGQAIRIVSGAFADRLGSIERLDDKGRVSVLLDILGAECSVRMNLDCLEPA